MELMLELFSTLVMILPCLVALLVLKIIPMLSDSGLSKSSNDPISRNASDDIFKSGRERSTVSTSPSETEVDATTSERVEGQLQVDRFQSQSRREHQVQVDSSVGIEHVVKDETAEEAVQPHSPEVMVTDDFGQQSEAFELQEKSSGQNTEADDAISLRDKKEWEVDDTVKQRSEDKPMSSTEVSVEPSSEEEMVVHSKEVFRVDAASDPKEIVEQKKHFLDFDDEDDWEGIESTELEKVFAAAIEFVDGDESNTNERLFKIGSDVQMEMYGLQKIAIEGPCREPQPMVLKISARAKWNAWQQLGNMNPEEAMEKYTNLLSDRVPEWMKETSMGHVELKSTEAKPEILTSAFPDLGSSMCHQPIDKNERNLGFNAGAKQDDHVGSVKAGSSGEGVGMTKLLNSLRRAFSIVCAFARKGADRLLP